MKKDRSVFKIIGRCWSARYGRVRFRLVDINCIAYLSLLALLLVFFHKSVSKWEHYVLLHAVLVVAVMEIVRLGERNPHRNSLWILRTFYPVAVILFGWGEIDALGPMFFGAYWSTEAVIRLDKFLFGVHPTVWVQKFYRPWLDELMCIFYSGYYLFLPIVSLTLFIKKKRDETLAAFSVVTLTYFSNYLLFFLFPTLSPAMADALHGLNTQQYTGYIMAGITRLVQAHGAVRGGTIPSSHISAAFVWSFVAFRYQKKLGYGLLPLAFAVAVSTVYLGYHHAVDPILGIVWALLWYPVALRIIKARDEDPIIG
ncbi:MAG: phosphatase PAP2 family protein [Candidatus Aminicenantales bacterium]